MPRHGILANETVRRHTAAANSIYPAGSISSNASTSAMVWAA
jgi:hypothetical protein